MISKIAPCMLKNLRGEDSLFLFFVTTSLVLICEDSTSFEF
jgi:hypothetical protein